MRGAGAFPVAQSRALPDGRAHGFAALANIGVLRAGRAQPLYLLTPAGRFALRATAHRADASLRAYTPIVTWQDKRAYQQAQYLQGALAGFLKDGTSYEAKLLWFYQNHPELFREGLTARGWKIASVPA